MNTQGLTEEQINARMMRGITRDEAIQQLQAELAGDIPEFEIAKKTSAGLSRAQAIQVIKTQRADDARREEEANASATADRPDLFTTERFERMASKSTSDEVGLNAALETMRRESVRHRKHAAKIREILALPNETEDDAISESLLGLKAEADDSQKRLGRLKKDLAHSLGMEPTDGEVSDAELLVAVSELKGSKKVEPSKNGEEGK